MLTFEFNNFIDQGDFGLLKKTGGQQIDISQHLTSSDVDTSTEARTKKKVMHILLRKERTNRSALSDEDGNKKKLHLGYKRIQ